MPLERAQVRQQPRPAAEAAAAAASTTTSSRSDSPAVTATSTTASSSSAALRPSAFVEDVRHCEDENVRALLHRLPSSPKHLLRRLEQQQQEMHLLKEANIRLQSREVEVASLTLRLQERISTTQSQVDHIKSQVQLQLANPITEEEYHRIDGLAEAERDLVDAMKLGIYRQLGSLRASQQAATRRAAELSQTIAQLQQEGGELKVRLAEYEAHGDTAKEAAARSARQLTSQQARIAELEGHVAALESRQASLLLDQEQYLSARLTSQVKTEEVARLSVRLEEAEMDTQRHRANAECTEQKLDILKAEYYELKMRYAQRVLELEGALKASEEKLKTLGDLEMESELFMANIAASAQGELAFRVDPPDAAAGRTTTAYEGWLALPRSRKLAHSLVVTKRCLHLENKVSALEHDLEFKSAQMARLQVALDGARDALHNINSPYVLIEKAMAELADANESLTHKVAILEQEKADLRASVQQQSQNLRLLAHHRKELLRMKKVLRQLGLREGFVVPSNHDDGEDREDNRAEAVAHSRAVRGAGASAPSPTQLPRASPTAARRHPDGAAAEDLEVYRVPGHTPPASCGSLKAIEMHF
ncbi:hypothetical protein NESM_000205100 [Novymonas esmeraldas]|uniref:Uncharacterized protein n=1 Tax=Novymonas esmeraldas TaxID=1808958 RepID=A0AAW0F6T8_9TRYP